MFAASSSDMCRDTHPSVCRASGVAQASEGVDHDDRARAAQAFTTAYPLQVPKEPDLAMGSSMDRIQHVTGVFAAFEARHLRTLNVSIERAPR